MNQARTEAEIMAPAVERFFARGAGRGMDENRSLRHSRRSRSRIQSSRKSRRAANDLLLYSLEVTGAGCYWVEFSEAAPFAEDQPAYPGDGGRLPGSVEAAREAHAQTGELASHVHEVVAEKFSKHGFSLGHLSGHSIGTTMLEYPAIGAKSNVVLQENMIFSLHPQVVDQDGKVCLYTQDTYRIGKKEGECLADVRVEILYGRRDSATSCVIGCFRWYVPFRADPTKQVCQVAELKRYEDLRNRLWRSRSLFAAHLAKAAEVEVWAYDVWADHVAAIQKNGLRISGAADLTASLNATSDPKQLPRCDYGIVATTSDSHKDGDRPSGACLR